MKSFLSFCLLLISFYSVSSQTMLPRFLTAEEQATVKAGIKELNPVTGIETPPSSPVRSIAEWEELQAITVSWTYYNDPDIRTILIEIVRQAKEECNVIILCPTDQTSAVKNQLTNANVDWSTNVSFVEGDINSIWCRDYGGNPAYTNDVDSLIYVDWIYNRPRPFDDASPEIIANYLEIPCYTTTAVPNDLVNTGGNYMNDGLGTAFCSKLVMEENGPNNQYGFSNHSEEEVNDIMHDFLGIDRYIKMDVLPYDLIHHIDMHMKLLDEETLLVGQYPEGTADGPQIEANLEYVINNFMTPYGTPYKVVRIPQPPSSGLYPPNGDYRTYANAVFINKTVLLPLYQQQYDTTAIRIWQETLPGYNIVGIDCNAIIPLSGALHCITKEIGVEDPLWITHHQLTDVTESIPAGYEVNAKIKHKTGIASAKVYYSTDAGSNYSPVNMTLTNADEDIWTANIPEQPSGATIYYYINAVANSGKTQNRPMPAPEGYWKFNVQYTTGVEDLGSTTMNAIFPNPAKAITCIPVHAAAAAKTTIKIYTQEGVEVMSVFDGQVPAGDSKYFFNARLLPAGTYIVNMSTDAVSLSQKVIVVGR